MNVLPEKFRDKAVFREWVDKIFPTEIFPKQQKAIGKYNKNTSAFSSLLIPSSTVQLNSLGGLRSQYKPLKSIIIYLVIHLLILFPFLVTNSKFRKPKPEDDVSTTPIP